MTKALCGLLLAIFISSSLVTSAVAASVEEFYKGKA
ncbi:MAG: hypothetical protein K0Q83_2504, partial [Deltaproteobacteria bacterium]|nr:hypothetical protein [Deltaproteobacteria bacterium]